MASKGFAGRLDYLRWLWHLDSREPGSHRDFAEFAKVDYHLYMKWRDSVEAPGVRATAKAFVAGGLARLGATEAWLIDGQGDPPRPELWELWSAAPSKGGVKVADPAPRPRRRAEGA